MSRTKAQGPKVVDWKGAPRKNPVLQPDDFPLIPIIVDTWDPCNNFERKVAIAFLESGLEARPFHAMERAHAACVALGLVYDDA